MKKIIWLKNKIGATKMKIMNVGHYRWGLGLLVVIGTLISSLSIAWTAQEWTAIGSSGTMNRVDSGKVLITDAKVAVNPTILSPATVKIRYNVVSVGGITMFDGHSMTIRFRDNGTGAQVIARLKRQKIMPLTKSETFPWTMLTLDSNTFTSSSVYQTQFVPGCSAGINFDFTTYTYFIEVELRKTDDTGTPGIELLQLGGLVC